MTYTATGTPGMDQRTNARMGGGMNMSLIERLRDVAVCECEPYEEECKCNELGWAITALEAAQELAGAAAYFGGFDDTPTEPRLSKYFELRDTLRRFEEVMK
jgi:hypothetical protein